MSGAEFCRDTLWGGALVLWQPIRGAGYRFTLDPILLAGFVAQTPGPLGHVLELGSGCGVLGLMLLASGRAQHVTAVERQPELARLLRRNGADNRLTARLTVLEGDLRQLNLPVADKVVFNPPYHPQGVGRASACLGRDAGRREVHGTLDDFVAAAARALGPGGSLTAILPAARATAWQRALAAQGLRRGRERGVQAVPGGPVRHRLLQATQGPPGTFGEEPAWVVHAPPGRSLAAEAAALVAGELPKVCGQYPGFVAASD